jgi:hypothetical protein
MAMVAPGAASSLPRGPLDVLNELAESMTRAAFREGSEPALMGSGIRIRRRSGPTPSPEGVGANRFAHAYETMNCCFNPIRSFIDVA